ncbi:MAG: hypothetical protein PHQ40_17965 [Anaerolineaceae bacterium]|nr:hypothetical protein [Anaerolineaceae bacterium]
MSLTGRIGCFFLLVGGGLLGLFLASDRAHTPVFNYLIAGAGLFLFGLWLWSKGKSAPRRSGRFRILRRPGTKDEETDE